MALYAAYGSNLDPEQMRIRAPHSPHRGNGWLHGWRITFGGEEFGWEGSIATIVEDVDSAVYVSIYDLTEEDEVALDNWEGAELNLYSKIHLRVETLSQSHLCWVYVLNSYEGGFPSYRYLKIMTDAAEIAGAPTQYVDDLRARPVIDLD
ncbi:MAG: gamma-glutamylcyclotransferase [Actinobacteria bacterium]|jgi:gamma-glutamylcyclotransferase (GGCT)/AIG2-like uncharacterized protein YtfP|nr:gamma-glutamylcyclotransferase [Actinomycetota bacterium]MDA2984400.1 gamma-glutamylcyclotransferase [Actinomycetota bacterium]